MILRDEEFLREKVPMTKFPLRAEAFFRLNIEKGDKFLDIGTGTGSISVQAALLGAEVWGIDGNLEAIALTEENAKRHGVKISLIEGLAPDNLPDIIFNSAFIGGASKKIPEVLDYLNYHLIPDGIVVANFILTSSLETFLNEARNQGYTEIEAGLRQSANMSHHGLWKGENPIYIVSARRKA